MVFFFLQEIPITVLQSGVTAAEGQRSEQQPSEVPAELGSGQLQSKVSSAEGTQSGTSRESRCDESARSSSAALLECGSSGEQSQARKPTLKVKLRVRPSICIHYNKLLLLLLK